MSSIYYPHGFKVSPRSGKNIAQLAKGIREIFEITGYCPIIEILEFGWGKYLIKSFTEMGDNLGLTQPDGTILLREDVYHGACEDHGFHRFTVAHEIGHVLMHVDQIGFARTFEQQQDKVYCNSEWQANEFAGCLLVPDFEVKALHSSVTAKTIATMYGVSLECAELRLRKIRGY